MKILKFHIWYPKISNPHFVCRSSGSKPDRLVLKTSEMKRSRWVRIFRYPIFEYSILFEYLLPSSASFHLPDLYSFSRWKRLSIKKVPWFRIPNPLVVRRASHSIPSPAPLRYIPPSWGLESPFLASCLRSSFARKNSDNTGLWLKNSQKSHNDLASAQPIFVRDLWVKFSTFRLWLKFCSGFVS